MQPTCISCNTAFTWNNMCNQLFSCQQPPVLCKSLSCSLRGSAVESRKAPGRKAPALYVNNMGEVDKSDVVTLVLSQSFTPSSKQILPIGDFKLDLKKKTFGL